MPSDRRLHPLSILFGLVAQVREFVFPAIVVLFTAGSAGWGWEVWTPLLLVPYVGLLVVRYVSFRYRYDEREMVIRSGLLFRNERHVPYARIQNLDAVQNVLHRLLGVVEVRVETGGGQEPEATLSVITTAALDEMRRRVFAERGGAPAQEAGAEPTVSAEGTVLLRLDVRDLALQGLIENRGMVLLGAAFGLVYEMGLFDRYLGRYVGEEADGHGVVRSAVKALLGQGGFPVDRILLGLAALAVFLLVVRLLSAAWAVVRLHGFTLTRVGDDLRTQYGLATRVSASIPLHRIQTLTVHEGPLHRLCGRAALGVDTAGGGRGGEDSTAQREWLAPVVRREQLPELLHAVLPGVGLDAVAWRPVDPRALGRELRRSLVAVCAVTLPWFALVRWWCLAPLAVLAAWSLLAARRTVAHLGYAVDDNVVLFRSGWLWRNVSVARCAKIQSVALHASPFDRRAGMASVSVDTAGATAGSHRVHVPYLARADAASLFGRLARQAAQTAFRW